MIRFLTAGESHGPALTTIVEGFPAGLPLSAARLWNGMWEWSISSRSRGALPPRQPEGPLPRQVTLGGRP